MNELTGSPSLTSQAELGQGLEDTKITSEKHGQRAGASSKPNQEILERTAQSAVLSVSRGELHAQSKAADTKSSDKALIDDLALAHKTTANQEGHEAIALAAQKEEKSKNNQGGNSDSFSEAEAKEFEANLTGKSAEDLQKLVSSLKALSKRDCRRVLKRSAADPSQAFLNLWDTQSTKRLATAAKIVDGFKQALTERLKSFTDFDVFDKFVKAKHTNPQDRILATEISCIANNYAKTQKRDHDLRLFFDLVHNERYEQNGEQSRVLRKLNCLNLKALLFAEQKSEKLHYQLEAAFRFSQIKSVNPLDRLREKLVTKFGNDKEICQKASIFKANAKTNLQILLAKLAKAVTEFATIALGNLLNLLTETNAKITKDLEAKPAADYVRAQEIVAKNPGLA